MENSDASNLLLKKKYDLHKTPEVETAALRTQQRTGEHMPQNPLDRIQNYLNRFHEIIDQKDQKRGEHGLDLIKGRFHARYIVKPDEIPDSYFENQKRLARELGHGDIEITPEARSQLTEVLIADQKSSLDKWINYLASSDAPYSDGLKYFTLRGVVNMAEYDKERKMYPQRSKGTTKPFPDLNREALAYVLDSVERKYKGQNIDLSKLDEKDAKEFDNLLKGENFAKLYAWAIEKVTPASEEELSATKGKWIKYNKNSDPTPLVQSLQGHGTGWCTAGESTAATHLKGGDFYAYYSYDKSGEPTVPRAAIRMEGNRIAEVRGIAPEQNLDSGAVAIVEEKLKEFPDGASYKKKTEDMRRLTAIENKTKENETLNKEDLVFLYEVDFPIEGFGYQKDPRIAQLRSTRNPQEDMPIVFGYDKSQIARSVGEINKNTKAYVGQLVPGIFDAIQKYNIEHVYTSFPEGKIRIESLTIGGRSKEQLLEDLRQAHINVSPDTKDMINSRDFITLTNQQIIKTVRLKVQDLGLKDGGKTNQVFASAGEIGLDSCPSETGVYQRLKDKSQPLGEWYSIAMKQIAGRSGRPYVFDLNHYGAGLWASSWADPERHWSPEYEFVFSLRKSDTSNPGLLKRILKR